MSVCNQFWIFFHITVAPGNYWSPVTEYFEGLHCQQSARTHANVLCKWIDGNHYVKPSCMCYIWDGQES